MVIKFSFGASNVAQKLIKKNKPMSLSTSEIAARLIELCNEGKYEQAQRELYADDAESVEPDGAQGMTSVKGLDAIVEKGHQFTAMVEEFHGTSASEPVISNNFFAYHSVVDVTFKGMGRVPMSELAVYETRDGKIVKEQFFYTPRPM